MGKSVRCRFPSPGVVIKLALLCDMCMYTAFGRIMIGHGSDDDDKSSVQGLMDA